MIYLASPYSDPEPTIQQARYLAAEMACIAFARQHMPVFSPIVHWHNAALRHKLPTDAVYWKEQNMSILACAHRVGVLMLLGWEQSLGVREEVEHALRLHKLVRLYKLHNSVIVPGKLLDGTELS